MFFPVGQQPPYKTLFLIAFIGLHPNLNYGTDSISVTSGLPRKTKSKIHNTLNYSKPSIFSRLSDFKIANASIFNYDYIFFYNFKI
jgi:hypothetical protein